VLKPEPQHSAYDVVIVGGAMIGSAIAWHLACRLDFPGRILVVERDPGFRQASTSLTNSCMRQQFSTPLNVRMSQYCAAFARDFREEIGDGAAPRIHVQAFGYLYLADNEDFAAHLRRVQTMQAGLGAGTRILSRADMERRFPYFDLDGIILGSFNDRDEGYFDGATMLDWWRRMARRRGVETVHGEVVAISRTQNRASAVTLARGTRVNCGWLVNAAGTRAAELAAMAGIAGLPVEPRKRYTYVIAAENPPSPELPLTIDPSGVHMRSDGAHYMIGAAPVDDTPVDSDDFSFDHSLWENRVWPAIAARVPAFERVRVLNEWVGHYAYNRIDRNAILGPHPKLDNFLFANGFSGHGYQHAPAVGRGIAEWIVHGRWQSLDLEELTFARVAQGAAGGETAVI